MKDLFEAPSLPRGKMRDLARWIRYQGHVKTSEVNEWGVVNYYVSAVRSAQLLAERGFLRRLSDGEVKALFGKELGQGVWTPTMILKEANLS